MCWIYPTITILALAGSAALCHAASPIVYDFASDLQGWSGAEPTGMAATYTWNPTNGSTGGGWLASGSACAASMGGTLAPLPSTCPWP